MRRLLQIMAGAEMPPRARHDDQADLAAIGFDIADMRAKFAKQLAVDRVSLGGTVQRQCADAASIVPQDERFAHATSPRVLAIAAAAVPLSRARLPNCSRIGTNSGITKDRRSQFAASTTSVCPLI